MVHSARCHPWKIFAYGSFRCSIFATAAPYGTMVQSGLCKKHYVVPGAGLNPPPSEQDALQEEILIRTIPYESLHHFMPRLLSWLLLENELDQRVVLGVDRTMRPIQ